jgi:hypothetical protein
MASGLSARSVIPALLRGDYVNLFERDAVLNTGQRLPGVRSASYTEKAWGDSRYITTAAGANKIFEMCHSTIVEGVSNTGAANAILKLPFDYSRLINPNPPSTVAAGDCHIGIEWGSLGIAPPWNAANFAITPPQAGAIQLRYNFTLARFEVAVFSGGTDDPNVVACTYQPTFLPDTRVVIFRMIWTPGATIATGTLTAYLNNRFAGSWRSSDLPQLEDFVSGNGNQHGFFVTNGSNAGNAMVEQGFFRGVLWRPLMP